MAKRQMLEIYAEAFVSLFVACRIAVLVLNKPIGPLYAAVIAGNCLVALWLLTLDNWRESDRREELGA